MYNQIVKFGSNCLFDEKGELNYSTLRNRANEIKELNDQGVKSTIVVSGAIALQKRIMNDTRSTSFIDDDTLAAYAATGQIELMNFYKTVFHGLYGGLGQILVKQSDFYDSNFSKNIKGTTNALQRLDHMIAFNTNDVETREEISTDNDMLAEFVAEFMGAKRVLILGQYDGFYQDYKDKSTLIEKITEVTNEHFDLCNGTSSDGTGGFNTKLIAGNYGLVKGIRTIIGNVNENIIDHVNESVSHTVFDPVDYYKHMEKLLNNSI